MFSATRPRYGHHNPSVHSVLRSNKYRHPSRQLLGTEAISGQHTVLLFGWTFVNIQIPAY